MPKKVLILDDNEDILDAMQQSLEFAGFNVKIIKKADGIFALIEQYKPDIIILDYLLHGANGGEICQQIKNSINTSHIPVIIISAHSRAIYSPEKYGCEAFVAKPFELWDLVDKINTYTIGYFPALFNASNFQPHIN